MPMAVGVRGARFRTVCCLGAAVACLPSARAADLSAPATDPRELQLYRVPNLPENGEAYYAPDGQWIVFGRQIDGNADLWRMRSDGSEQTQLTFTEDWQEGEAYFLRDSATAGPSRRTAASWR